jgi:hypothetical protein
MSIEVTDQLSDHAIFFVDEGRRKKLFFQEPKNIVSTKLFCRRLSLL